MSPREISSDALGALRRQALENVWERVATENATGGQTSPDVRQRCIRWLDKYDIRNERNIEFVIRMCLLTDGAFLEQPHLFQAMEMTPIARDHVLTILQRSIAYRRE